MKFGGLQLICPRRVAQSNGGRCSAFTLVELMVAITVTSIMSVCIAAMIHSVAVGTESQQDGRRHLTRATALQARLMTQIHSARAILATGNGYLVYWTGDEAVGNTVNKSVDLSEMNLIQLNTSTNQLILYTKAAGVSDSTYSNRTTWYTASQTAKSSNWYTSTVLANNVTAFNTTATNSTVTNAREVFMTVTISDGYITRNACFAVGLRAWAAPI